MTLYSYDRRASAEGKRNALWSRLNESQRDYVRRGFDVEQEDKSILIHKVPIGDFAYEERSLWRAESDLSQGRHSKTKGPVSVRYDPDKDTFFLIDGYHRLAAAIENEEQTVDVEIVGAGYSNYWATP